MNSEPYIVSARKYRPATFASVVGQKSLTATLKNAVATGRLAHSYLFCGSRGVGKTSCARIFAKTINCLHPLADGEACNECENCRSFIEGNSMNIIELDAASNNSVDDIRQLVDQVQMPPSQGRYRVFIIDEVHMLSSAAFNAFLKTLEEPPEHAIFILATTEKHKIIPTILSRCQIYDFNRITVSDIAEHLAYVAQCEGMTAEPQALGVIARKADGAMRDALSIFDQVAACTRGNITYADTIANLNVLDHTYYGRLLDAFLKGEVLQTWLIYKEIRDKGFDSHFLINGLADYMRDLMVASDTSTLSLLEVDQSTAQAMSTDAAKCTPGFLYRAMNLLNDADLNFRIAANKQFLVELTLAKICQSVSPSPTNAGAGEGQLQPIAGATAATPAAPVQTPQPQKPAVAMPQSPPMTSSAPRLRTSSPAQGPTLSSLKTIRTFSRPNQAANISETGHQATSSPQRRADYTDDALKSAWHSYMAAHPTDHILVNAMRAHFLQNAGNGLYTFILDNAIQEQIVAEALPELTAHLRNSLSNDTITLKVEINQGESSPLTWSDHEVLDRMIENAPVLREFIDKFRLTIG